MEVDETFDIPSKPFTRTGTLVKVLVFCQALFKVFQGKVKDRDRSKPALANANVEVAEPRDRSISTERRATSKPKISGNDSLSNQNNLNLFQDCRDHLGYLVQRAVSHELHVYRHAFRKSERLECVLLKITAIL